MDDFEKCAGFIKMDALLSGIKHEMREIRELAASTSWKVESQAKDHRSENKETRELISKNFDKIYRIIKERDEKILTMLEKKAGKWVEKIIIWAGGVVGGFLTIYALNQIFNHQL